nr:hypothetical protein pLIS51_00131c [Listeria seeligeri]
MVNINSIHLFWKNLKRGWDKTISKMKKAENMSIPFFEMAIYKFSVFLFSDFIAKF